MEFKSGLQIGEKYVLLEPLGQGGQASIWRAEQKGLAGFTKEIALKFVLPGKNTSLDAQDSLLREARLAALLSHPNIVQVYDVGKENGIVFVAMERIHGKDLQYLFSNYIRRKKEHIPWPILAYIVMEVCEALHYAHNKTTNEGQTLHLIHRDLKPQNIVLSRDGHTKLIDFGIAKTHETGPLTQTGSIKGTPSYMSPEQINAKLVDHRSDLFSLGSLLYECSSGAKPFTGKNLFVLMDKVIHKKPIPLKDLVPDLHDGFVEIVSRLMMKKPQQRYQSALEVQEAFRSLLAQQNIQVERKALIQFYAECHETGIQDHLLDMSQQHPHTSGTKAFPKAKKLSHPSQTKSPSETSLGKKAQALHDTPVHLKKQHNKKQRNPGSASSTEWNAHVETLHKKLSRMQWILFLLFATLVALLVGIIVDRDTNPIKSSKTMLKKRRVVPLQKNPPQQPRMARTPSRKISSRQPNVVRDPKQKVTKVPKKRTTQTRKKAIKKMVLRSKPTLSNSSKEKPVGFVLVDIQPRCRIYVGRSFMGISKALRIRRRVGRWRLRCLNRKQRLYRTFRVRVKPEKTTVVRRKYRQGRLFVLSFPWSYIRLSPFGKIGHTQGVISLPEGRYTVTLHKANNPSQSKKLSVVIRAGKMTKPAVVRW